MCGFAGFVDLEASRGRGELEAIAQHMSEPLTHRGPDGHGVWTDEAAGIALGHRRLAIIDLSPAGAQPMTSASGRLIIALNGEIYNHPELRTELEASGHTLRGTSDTEVLVEIMDRLGIEAALERAVGMFALAIWDRESRTLTLARDRLGEKPLYYGWAGKSFLFGSTLRALKRHPEWNAALDLDVLALYFRTSYVPGPYSIFRGFRKLMPGSSLRLPLDAAQAGHLPSVRPYWSLLDVARRGISDPFEGTDAEALGHLEELLGEAVRGQMIADVPLGAFLSGGIDSGCVVAMMQQASGRPVRTFTVGFKDMAYDESRRARKIAAHLGTEHTELVVTADDVLRMIPRMPEFYEEPFGDSSQVPTSIVAQLARQHVTVSLSGDGGDEVFCGYNRLVQLMRIHEKTKHLPKAVKSGGAALLRAFPSSAYEAALRRGRFGVLGDQVQKLATILDLRDLDEKYLRLATQWDDPLALVLGAEPLETPLTSLSSWPHDLPALLRLMWVEATTSLPDDMLTKVDRAGMGSSLESRMPLLDHRVIEFAWSLPERFRVRDGKSKWALRQILHKHVPPSLLDRPKSGFSIPIDSWLRDSLRGWAEELLSADRLKSDGFLDATRVRQCWHDHLSGRRKEQAKLWSVLMFQAWLDRERAAA